jgi:hypothetical protein
LVHLLLAIDGPIRHAVGWHFLGYLVTMLSALTWPWPLSEL